ncbi:uncharacterized protein LOC122853768 [Aphidius gifuensis]|uniref:uncharacterized protein LOC122853768 n=1 Tax=Aphidius gifuensis TaxID=684658 RepID=UPI001CDC3170|nr:uncharacterized protein LOC122853768 [Aphidius gifuensis]
MAPVTRSKSKPSTPSSSSSENDTNVKYKLNINLSRILKNYQSRLLVHTKAWKTKHQNHLINLFYHAFLDARIFELSTKQMIEVARKYFENQGINKFYCDPVFLKRCLSNSVILRSLVLKFKDPQSVKIDRNNVDHSVVKLQTPSDKNDELNKHFCKEQNASLNIEIKNENSSQVLTNNDVLKKPSNQQIMYVDKTAVNNKLAVIKTTTANDLLKQADILSTINVKENALNNDFTSKLLNEVINNSGIHKLSYHVINIQEKIIVKRQVKLLVILSSDKIRLITFNLLNKKYYVNDLLLQAGILLDKKPEVSHVVHPILGNINYIVECETTKIMINSIKINYSASILTSKILFNPKNYKYSCKLIDDPKDTIVKQQIKILVVMPNNNERLITFNLLNDKCYLNDLLKRAGIPLNGKTKVSLVDNYHSLNIYYAVKYKTDEIPKPSSSFDTNTFENENLTSTVGDKCGASLNSFDCCKQKEENSTELVPNKCSFSNENNKPTDVLVEEKLFDNIGQKIACNDKKQLSNIKISTVLECWTIRIGLYEYKPEHLVMIDSTGLTLLVPRHDDKNSFVKLRIKYEEIIEVEIHCGETPALFLYTDAIVALKIQKLLYMENNGQLYRMYL